MVRKIPVWSISHGLVCKIDPTIIRAARGEVNCTEALKLEIAALQGFTRPKPPSRTGSAVTPKSVPFKIGTARPILAKNLPNVVPGPLLLPKLAPLPISVPHGGLILASSYLPKSAPQFTILYTTL